MPESTPLDNLYSFDTDNTSVSASVCSISLAETTAIDIMNNIKQNAIKCFFCIKLTSLVINLYMANYHMVLILLTKDNKFF